MSYSDKPLVLSSASLGGGILIPSTSAPGTLVHESSTEENEIDYLELFASNSSMEDAMLYLLWGDQSNIDKKIGILIEFQKGFKRVSLPQPVRGGRDIYAWASVTNVITLWSGGGSIRVTQTED